MVNLYAGYATCPSFLFFTIEQKYMSIISQWIDLKGIYAIIYLYNSLGLFHIYLF